jgi:hypothetical protein
MTDDFWIVNCFKGNYSVLVEMYRGVFYSLGTEGNHNNLMYYDVCVFWDLNEAPPPFSPSKRIFETSVSFPSIRSLKYIPSRVFLLVSVGTLRKCFNKITRFLYSQKTLKYPTWVEALCLLCISYYTLPRKSVFTGFLPQCLYRTDEPINRLPHLFLFWTRGQ